MDILSAVLDLLEEITGNRNNYGNVRVGGVREDIPDETLPKILKVLDLIEKKTWMLTKAVLDDPVLHARLKGVGTLSKEDAVRYAALLISRYAASSCCVIKLKRKKSNT